MQFSRIAWARGRGLVPDWFNEAKAERANVPVLGHPGYTTPGTPTRVPALLAMTYTTLGATRIVLWALN